MSAASSWRKRAASHSSVISTDLNSPSAAAWGWPHPGPGRLPARHHCVSVAMTGSVRVTLYEKIYETQGEGGGMRHRSIVAHGVAHGVEQR
jgi:hypothetical protein